LYKLHSISGEKHYEIPQGFTPAVAATTQNNIAKHGAALNLLATTFDSNGTVGIVLARVIDGVGFSEIATNWFSDLKGTDFVPEGNQPAYSGTPSCCACIGSFDDSRINSAYEIYNADFQDDLIYFAFTVGQPGLPAIQRNSSLVFGAVGAQNEKTSPFSVVSTYPEVQPNTVQDRSISVAFPSIAADGAGHFVLGYAEFSSSHFPQGLWFEGVLSPSQINFITKPALVEESNGPSYIDDGLKECPQDFGHCLDRWGDYSATVFDETTREGEFWTLQEYTFKAPDVQHVEALAIAREVTRPN
jgi:hypothetical protein